MHKILILFFLALPLLAWAQNKPRKVRHVHSDKIQKIPGRYDGNLLFSGNVHFEQDGASLKADSVVFYELENRLHAFPNARLNNGTQRLSTKFLNYDGNTKIAIAQDDVVLEEPEQTLTADKLVYNMTTNIAVATGNVVLRKVDGQTLYTNKLEYNRNTEKVY